MGIKAESVKNDPQFQQILALQEATKNCNGNAFMEMSLSTAKTFKDLVEKFGVPENRGSLMTKVQNGEVNYGQHLLENATFRCSADIDHSLINAFFEAARNMGVPHNPGMETAPETLNN